MSRLCLASNIIEARIKLIFLAVKERSNIEIKAKFIAKFDKVGVIEDEERMYCSKDIIFFINFV